MKELLLKLSDLFFKKKGREVFTQRFAQRYIDHVIYNINLDLTNPCQKKALMVYDPLIAKDVLATNHAKYYHENQMMHYFVSKGYALDICCYRDEDILKKISSRKYDVVIGQGLAFRKVCRQLANDTKKILFCSENNPLVVLEKYKERLEYFKERHPNVSTSDAEARIGIFTKDDFELSDNIILMSSQYNALSFREFFDTVYTINVNAISNMYFSLDKSLPTFGHNKNRFVTFGVTGLIHKGVDILCDAFRQRPQCQLDLYGVDMNKEYRILEKIKPTNVANCGWLIPSTEKFVTEIVEQHDFVILDSCSEGMASGVATCMMHGLIPIITKECGFNDIPGILVLDDFKVETVAKILDRISSMSEDEVRGLRVLAYQTAQKEFSIEKFTEDFGSVMDRIIS